MHIRLLTTLHSANLLLEENYSNLLSEGIICVFLMLYSQEIIYW